MNPPVKPSTSTKTPNPQFTGPFTKPFTGIVKSPFPSSPKSPRLAVSIARESLSLLQHTKFLKDVTFELFMMSATKDELYDIPEIVGR